MVNANHALALLVLVLAGAWIALYTNHFPVVGNLLGLSGVLAVIPAFVGLLPEAQRQGYLALVNRGLFGNRAATMVYLAALVGVFALFLGARPLEIEYLESGPTRTVSITYSDDDQDSIRISPLSEARLPVWSAPWSTPRVRVSSPGLPSREVDVSYLDKELAVPDDLWQEPVVLILPAVENLASIEEKKMSLEISVTGDTGEPITIPGYAGGAMWLGTDQPLEIPGTLGRQLETMERNVVLAMAGRSAEQRLKLASIVFNWSRPALSGIARLSPNDVVFVRLRARGNNCVMGETEIRLDGIAGYPHIEELRYDGECLD